MTKKQIREGIGLTALNLFFIVLCFVTLIPILYAVSVSLSGQNSLLSSDFSFIPKDFTLDNYKEVIFGEEHMGRVVVVGIVIQPAGHLAVADDPQRMGLQSGSLAGGDVVQNALGGNAGLLGEMDVFKLLHMCPSLRGLNVGFAIIVSDMPVDCKVIFHVDKGPTFML